jgi:hypothetical protein
MGLLSERAALREDAARLLEELGGTVGEVACSLYVVGIRALSCNFGESPAELYLKAVVGADPRVVATIVTKRSLVMKTASTWSPAVRVSLPRPVRQFVSATNRSRCRFATEIRLDDEEDA